MGTRTTTGALNWPSLRQRMQASSSRICCMAGQM